MRSWRWSQRLRSNSSTWWLPPSIQQTVFSRALICSRLTSKQSPRPWRLEECRTHGTPNGRALTLLPCGCRFVCGEEGSVRASVPRCKLAFVRVCSVLKEIHSTRSRAHECAVLQVMNFSATILHSSLFCVLSFSAFCILFLAAFVCCSLAAIVFVLHSCRLFS